MGTCPETRSQVQRLIEEGWAVEDRSNSAVAQLGLH